MGVGRIREDDKERWGASHLLEVECTFPQRTSETHSPMYVLPCPHVMTPSPLRRSRSYSPWYVHPEGSSESTGLDSTRGCMGVVNGGGGRASFLACFCRGVRACRAWYSDTEAAWLAGVRRMRPKP